MWVTDFLINSCVSVSSHSYYKSVIFPIGILKPLSLELMETSQRKWKSRVGGWMTLHVIACLPQKHTFMIPSNHARSRRAQLTNMGQTLNRHLQILPYCLSVNIISASKPSWNVSEILSHEKPSDTHRSRIWTLFYIDCPRWAYTQNSGPQAVKLQDSYGPVQEIGLQWMVNMLVANSWAHIGG
jgi:hypothetical protein